MKNFKYIYLLFICFSSLATYAQEEKSEDDKVYKKRVLENVEVDIVTSFYKQDGDNASVTGGIGTEELTDIPASITLSIPLNDDDVLVIDAGISAYSSASSSNLDPFDNSGASKGGDDDDDDDDHEGGGQQGGSPWVASSGESKQDVWGTISASYNHSSDDRNKIWNANMSFSAEYDYISFGFGGGFTRLFNEKNTEIGIKGSVFLDNWKPVYPTEIDTYFEENGNTNNGFFGTVDILNQSGSITDKTGGAGNWTPVSTGLITDTKRNNYALSLSFSQILSSRAQMSVFADFVSQQGWLANPMQRVYFKDRANYYIGEATSIPNYTSKSNKDVFHLADDIERLPSSRLKIPVGARLNYYVNEYAVIRSYYRYYSDDWGVVSNTYEVELPLKLIDKWTFSPSYRYYNQTQAEYFAPYNEHLSTQEFYTSDYDLSAFNSNQYGLMIRYTDIFLEKKIWQFGLKTAELKYSSYERNTGLKSGIVTIGFKFVMD